MAGSHPLGKLLLREAEFHAASDHDPGQLLVGFELRAGLAVAGAVPRPASGRRGAGEPMGLVVFLLVWAIFDHVLSWGVMTCRSWRSPPLRVGGLLARVVGQPRVDRRGHARVHVPEKHGRFSEGELFESRGCE